MNSSSPGNSSGCPFHRSMAPQTPEPGPIDPALAALPRATEAPVAPGLPLIGAGLSLLKDPYGWWPRQLERHGSVFQLDLPTIGGRWIALAGVDANELLAKEGTLFSQAETYPRATEVLGTSMHPSLTEGNLQRHLRRQVAPGFSRQAAAPHLPQMLQVTRDLVDSLKPGTDINVTEWTSRLGLNAMSVFATGRPLGHDTEGYRRYATAFTGTIALGWPMAWLRTPWVRRWRQDLDTLVETRLADHQAVPPGAERAPDFFDAVLRGTQPNGDPLPDHVRVVYGQIPFKNMGVYAGRVLNHMLYEFVKRPDLLERVLPEIDRVLGAKEVTLESLSTMEVFSATLKEVLRLRPIAVAVQRTVFEPFAFGGYRFEPGDKLFFPISATHFQSEYFPDPERFDVDRFLDGGPDVPQHIYNPFGLGHHSCVARGLFETLTLITVGSLLRRWQFNANYTLRTIVDALPGPWPWHRMWVVGPRVPVALQANATAPQRPRLDEWITRLGPLPQVSLAKDEVLFAQGDPPDRLYMVVSGCLEVRRAWQGQEQPVARLSPGQVVGEIGILHGVPRTASVIALEPTRLLAIDGDVFTDMVVDLDVTATEISELALRRHAAATLASALGTPDLPSLPSAGQVHAMSVEPGETVMRQGEPGDHAYLLVSGAVVVTVRREDGTERLQRTVHAPNLVGEIALLHGTLRTACVRGGEAGAQLIRLDRDAFDAYTRHACVQPELRFLSASRALHTARTAYRE